MSTGLNTTFGAQGNCGLPLSPVSSVSLVVCLVEQAFCYHLKPIEVSCPLAERAHSPCHTSVSARKHWLETVWSSRRSPGWKGRRPDSNFSCTTHWPRVLGIRLPLGLAFLICKMRQRTGCSLVLLPGVPWFYNLNSFLAFSNSFKGKGTEKMAHKTTLWAIRNRA